MKMEMDKENIVQAVVIMDTFNSNFSPLTDNKPMGFLEVAGVPLIDYVLESLALGGVGEAILFCCQNGQKIKEHVQKHQDNKSLWSLTMDIQILMSDTCQTMGDVMRELDAAALLKGYFVLAGINSITNMNFASLLEQHKQTCKKDKGTAMTLVYKKLSWEHPLISSDRSTFLAANENTKKVLVHKRYRPKSKEKIISLPLDLVLNNSEVKLHHNLVDTNIALCSPTVPPLFSDNFDFQTRDDFIHGILINEEILASSLYYTLLKSNQYAAAITNWKTYQTVCRDILHKWVYPLSIESGLYSRDKYTLTGNLNFVENSAMLSRSCVLTENTLIGAKTQVQDNTTVTKSIIGKKCTIGNNVIINGSHIMNNVIIKDNCRISNSFIDDNCVISEGSNLHAGTIIAENVKVESGSDLKGRIECSIDNDKKLQKSESSGTEWEESSGSSDEEFIGFDKVWSDSESCYSSISSADSSLPDSPVPDDTKMFLQEVIDSLARGYDEKLKCDYLILEINSSRYAYNIQLNEVNFFVVRALLSMPVLSEAKNVLTTVKDILKYFRPVLANYIKSKSSIMDCLRAVEDTCLNCEWLDGKSGQILHLLYEADVVDEDSLVDWYAELKENANPFVKQPSLVKFFEWLQEASEESDDSE
ncbi:translation initiation factor eIF-2B subunit epsilon isoform X1 [Bombyx mori]|uniref:Translation initiation factor eIF2B subunit epsilon n=2 Tax=Bombyx mori TaxID=7091 RepID=A0A8R1WKI1_BOMMO|nr:translation initiation factor eIF-2B subunit epsilon isoform X1 [Bombyx mori]XP_021204701.1 translation initiation factor eIF-2B subunit epsilon isoform X1 [Bombyx mori]